MVLDQSKVANIVLWGSGRAFAVTGGRSESRIENASFPLLRWPALDQNYTSLRLHPRSDVLSSFSP